MLSKPGLVTERLLQFIWQFQYFNNGQLESTQGEKLHIISPGQFNHHQGPDFCHARIRINNIEWIGNIELHICSTDWKKHRHQFDDNYRNVILHVVWLHDENVNELPVLELNPRIPKILLQRYEELMHSTAFISCENSINLLPDFNWQIWKDRLLTERLLRKSGNVEALLQENKYHWEETFWWLLARNFGRQVNADLFETIARSIPVKLLAKHKNQIHQLESLLLGQAGLLTGDFKDHYAVLEKKEYQCLKKAYRLRPISIPVHFLRMRPYNFPTIRLAQLAMLIHESSHLFSRIREFECRKDLYYSFDITANDYWHYHYRFDEISDYRPKKLGESMIDNIIINTIVPVLFTYGHYHDGKGYKEKALRWLKETDAEDNHIISRFEKIGIAPNNAYDTQALIEMKNEYCSKRRCLDCMVGNCLLKI